jgi:RHS repeat-associated protein
MHRYGWGGEVQQGAAGQSSDIYYTYANNRRTDHGFTYDASGDLTFDGGQHFTYDAAGRQTYVDWTNLQQGYDGDGLRVSRTEDGTYPALFLRSSVLGGQVVAEIDNVNGTWTWWRGYVYSGSQLLAVQQGSAVYFVHEDPVTKSKRVTDMGGVVQSGVELDPYGADTARSMSSAFQPKKFTSYERDANGTDEAMARRYNRWHSRFDQPDPYDGSYDLTNPQSFNRYSYTQGDPVNFVDPTGTEPGLVPVCPDGNPCPIDFGGVTVIGHLDPFDASFGGPPPFGGPVITHEPPVRGGGPGGGGVGVEPQRRIEDKIRQKKYERKKKEQQKNMTIALKRHLANSGKSICYRVAKRRSELL